jgi:hypothetical protein
LSACPETTSTSNFVTAAFAGRRFAFRYSVIPRRCFAFLQIGLQKNLPLGSAFVDWLHVLLQIFQACQRPVSQEVQAPLPEDPSLQVPRGEVDLPVEHLRRYERSDLLPLIVGDDGLRKVRTDPRQRMRV